MKLIGISGKKRSGKDTFYQMLSEHSNLPVHRLAFADTLKNEVFSYILQPDNLERSLLDNDNTKEQFRTLLQWWGTEYRRKMFQDDYWLVKMAQQIQQFESQDVIVVITDVRFPNEFEFIKTLGGTNIRIERPDMPSAADAHPSETALDNETNFSTVITNNGTMEQLSGLVKAYANSMSAGQACHRMASVG